MLFPRWTQKIRRMKNKWSQTGFLQTVNRGKFPEVPGLPRFSQMMDSFSGLDGGLHQTPQGKSAHLWLGKPKRLPAQRGSFLAFKGHQCVSRSLRVPSFLWILKICTCMIPPVWAGPREVTNSQLHRVNECHPEQFFLISHIHSLLSMPQQQQYHMTVFPSKLRKHGVGRGRDVSA